MIWPYPVLGIFYVHTDVDACGGCINTVRESALRVDWEKNPLPHGGIEPASVACLFNALPAELHPPGPKRGVVVGQGFLYMKT